MAAMRTWSRFAIALAQMASGGVVGTLTLLGCGINTPRRPVPFDPSLFSESDDWYCSTGARNTQSFCHRTMRKCAREQARTVGSGACVDWKEPVFCFTHDRAKGYLCFTDEAACSDVSTKSRQWRYATDFDQKHVSLCHAVP